MDLRGDRFVHFRTLPSLLSLTLISLPQRLAAAPSLPSTVSA